MNMRQLGTTDIMVSKICLGTMTRGHQNTEQEAHQQLDYALSQGINFIDTAEVYTIPPTEETQGLTETYIGNWMKERGNRQDIVLATKVTGKGFERIRQAEGFTPNGIREAVSGSLKRLQTDYIDLYQLHRPNRLIPVWGKLNYEESMWETDNRHEEDILATLETMDNLIKEGKIRAYGLSNETARGTMKYINLAEKHGRAKPQSIQNAYNLLRREYDASLAEVSMQEQCGLLAYSPLAGGILTGKYQQGAMPKGSRYATRGKKRIPYNAQQQCFDAVDEYIKLAQELDITVTQLALAWVNDRQRVTSNIIGATTMQQLEECISSATISLDAEAHKKIATIFNDFPNPATW